MSEKQTSRKKRNRKLNRYLLLLFSASVMILYLIIYTFPDVTGALKRTKIIEYGSVQVKDSITCWFIRDEEVFFADRSGTINYYVEEGEQVRKGTKILDIMPGGVEGQDDGYSALFRRLNEFQNGENLFTGDLIRIDTMISQLEQTIQDTQDLGKKDLLTSQLGKLKQKRAQIQSAGQQGKRELNEQTIADLVAGKTPVDHSSTRHGLVSYFVDGYEAELTPDTMKLLDQRKIKQIQENAVSMHRKTTLRHEPLYKLIQNSVWYAVTWVEPSDIAKYSKGARITLQLPLGPVEGIVYDLQEEDGALQVIFQFDRYYSELAQLRRIETDVITLDYKGLTIENQSILTQDGQPGVMVKDVNGTFHFKPIKIITSDGEYSLVETAYYYEEKADGLQKVETVDVYDEILSRP